MNEKSIRSFLQNSDCFLLNYRFLSPVDSLIHIVNKVNENFTMFSFEFRALYIPLTVFTLKPLIWVRSPSLLNQQTFL